MKVIIPRIRWSNWTVTGFSRKFMNLGFIGTGKIASSVITGICQSKITYKKIIISPRNKKIAQS